MQKKQRNQDNYSKSKKRRSKISKVLILSTSAIFLSVLFILYGPFSWVRVFLITTSMHTSEHQYIAKLLFPQPVIATVMDENKVIETDDKTDSSNMQINGKDDIELIKIRETMYSGVLLKISNPAKISVAVSDMTEGMLLEEIAEKANAIAAINASGYKDIKQQGVSEGLVISDSKKYFDNNESQHSLIGFNKNNKLILGKFSKEALDELDLRDAIDFDGPFLIINGNKSVILGNGGGISPRSAIGQTKDGTVLLLALDGRQAGSIGATIRDVQDILFQYGAENAANLDGGSSVSMFYNGEIVNSLFQSDSHRRLPCCFLVK